MDARKAEFDKLVKIMGWSQTVAAQKLGKTPSAINHLLNPHHPNRPTIATMILLRKHMADQDSDCRPDFRGERELIRHLRMLPPKRKEKVFPIIQAILRLADETHLGNLP